MGKLLFISIAFIAVVGFLIGVGAIIGGAFGAGTAGEDHTELVNACIERNGGSVTKDELADCIAEES